MFKRLFWLSVGVGAGATGAVITSRWLARQAERLAPKNVGRRAGQAAAGAVAEFASRLGAAIEEFRAGAAEREAELRRAAYPDEHP